jgi:uncharacterized membrane protein
VSILRRVFITGAIMWAALIPLAPLAASQPAPARFWYPLALVLYAAGSVVCHQLPERSFHLWSAQAPVCARCTGIYLGAAVLAACAIVWPRTARPNDDVRRTRALLAIAVLPTLVTLAYEWTTGDTPSNAWRAFAGAPLGSAVAFVVMSGVR